MQHKHMLMHIMFNVTKATKRYNKNNVFYVPKHIPTSMSNNTFLNTLQSNKSPKPSLNLDNVVKVFVI